MNRFLTLLMVLSALALILVQAVALHHTLTEERARECSTLLHGYSNGTIVPLTEDASVEIGACILQFNQPLGEDG